MFVFRIFLENNLKMFMKLYLFKMQKVLQQILKKSLKVISDANELYKSYVDQKL